MFGPREVPSGVQPVMPPPDASTYLPPSPSGHAASPTGQLPNGTTVALTQAGPGTATTGPTAQVLAPSAGTAGKNSLPVPAAASTREGIKSSREFVLLLGRLNKHNVRIYKTAQYRAFTHGDRYEGLLPELRTAWPGSPAAWGEGVALNGSYIQVGGKHIAIATQYPLPGKSLFAFLQQLIADQIRTIVVLASDAEIADPKEQLPDYFRPSAARANLNLPQEAGIMVPDGPDVLGSYVSGGIVAGGRCLTVVSAIEPMHPLAEPGLGNIRRGVIEVSSGLANPFRPMLPQKQAIRVIHLHNIPQMGVPTLAELEWLGEVVRAERQSGRLALVHCNSGTGRSGLVLAASVLADPSSDASVETVVADIRASRHWRALSAEDQLAGAVLVARAHGKPVLAPDSAVP